MWADLQETFYIVLGPFVADLLLPGLVAAGIILSVVMALSRWWRPALPVRIVRDRDEI